MTLAYRFVPPSSTLMLWDRLSGHTSERQWVPLSAMPSSLVRAVVVAEDGRFCAHHGIDWQAAQKAFAKNETRGRITHGASTIPMQVAKNLFLWNGRLWLRKALEAPLALWIDLTWPKSRIIEVYLNIVEWGPHIYGAEAAARYHFGRPARQLTAYQSALLAAALPNPKERHAGRPGSYTRAYAASIARRMGQSPGVAACVGR